MAIALAQASHGRVTALHVADRQRAPRSWRRELGAAIAPIGGGEAIIREIVRLGDHYDVEVRGMVRHAESPPEAILRQLKIGDLHRRDAKLTQAGPEDAERPGKLDALLPVEHPRQRA